MRYEGQIYRPPSEAESYILQATIGCSWNKCVYCDMYREKDFRVRELSETLVDLRKAAEITGGRIDKIFVADGDALVLDMPHWRSILDCARAELPFLSRVSCYATAENILNKTPEELSELRERGLSLLYIGPESGDDKTLKRIAKGSTFADHVEAAHKAHAAGMRISVITLLGIGGVERSQEHAERTAALVTEMNPEYFSALTTSVVPNTPLVKLRDKGFWKLPDVTRMLEELRTIVDLARPTNAVFRTNHASNYLPLAGQLPRDSQRIVAAIDAALAGKIPLRPDWARGL
ncbi:MAG TPA: radical SAM protein [Polyangiales bacterium]|nr:radical SAM protein [Polyangiales bacterium]